MVTDAVVGSAAPERQEQAEHLLGAYIEMPLTAITLAVEREEALGHLIVDAENALRSCAGGNNTNC